MKALTNILILFLMMLSMSIEARVILSMEELSLEPAAGQNIIFNTTAVNASFPLKIGASKELTSGLINLTTEITSILPVANGGTGSASSTFVDLASSVFGVLPITSGGTGSVSTTFVDLTSNVFGITPIANGGTGSATKNFVDLTTPQTVNGSKTFTNKFTALSTTEPSIPCPVMTEAQRDAVGVPVEGDCIFNSDTNITNIYTGSAWEVISKIGDYVESIVSSTDNAIVRWDGVSGTTVQDYTSGFPTISDTGYASFADAGFSGRVTFRDGDLTGANPAISFLGMLDGGLWRDQIADSLKINVNGNQIQEWETTYSALFAPLWLQQYNTASLPVAWAHDGAIVYDSSINEPMYSDGLTWIGLLSAGGVTGPVSGTSTDHAIVRWDGVSGTVIQDYTSGAPTISDTGVASFSVAGFSGQVTISDGSVTEPSLAFTNMIDGGLWRDSISDSVKMNVNGVELQEWEDTYVSVKAPLWLQQYATGSLPAAASHDGGITYDSTINKPVFSDGVTWGPMGGGGDVVGPTTNASSDNAITRWDGTTGKLVQNSNVIVDDDGRVDPLGLGGSVYIGTNAGVADDLTANNNVGIGSGALQSVTSGFSNVAIGQMALNTITTGNQLMAVGEGALRYNTSGGLAVAMGFNSLHRNTSGQINTAVGMNASMNNKTGSGNTALGFQALDGTNGSNHDLNTGVGAFTGEDLTTGSNNVFIGHMAGKDATTGSRNILIGESVTLPLVTTDDYLSIGDIISGNVSVGYVSTAGVFSTGQFATGSLPTAASFEGYLAYDTTLSEPVFSDGATWTSLVTAAGGGATILNPSEVFFGGPTGLASGTADFLWSNGTKQLLVSGTISLFNDGAIQFYENSANGSNSVGFQVNADLAATTIYTLPDADGTASYTLSTDGSGGLTWQPAPASAAQLDLPWGLVVGSAAQVAAGNATHASITNAVASATATNNRITMLAYITEENVSISKEVHIFGNGSSSSDVSGTMTWAIGSDDSSIDRLRVRGNTNIVSGPKNIKFGRLFSISTTATFDAASTTVHNFGSGIWREE